MTATVRQVRVGHWSDVAANQPKYPQPSDPQIKTKADVAQSMFVWFGSVFVGLGLIALAAYLIRSLMS